MTKQTLPCPRCGSKKQYSKNEDYINHDLCEYDVTCSFCDYTYDYFAYGNFESDNPNNPTFCWHNIKLDIKFIFQKIYYTTKRNLVSKK